MLINAIHREELRVAIADNQKLLDFHLQQHSRATLKSNVYKATITRLEPSLEAAFADFGGNRPGFLPYKNVSPQYRGPAGAPNKGLSVGQELIIQVEKGQQNKKGAALTTYISLAGRYLVLRPNSSAGGISQRARGKARESLRTELGALKAPPDVNVIARTAGIGCSTEDLQRDFDHLIGTWERIKEEAGKVYAPYLLYREGDLLTRAIRDFLREDFEQIVVDEPATFERTKELLAIYAPREAHRLVLFEKPTPLFSHHQIEGQIEQIYRREVKLKSGGYIVIDQVEALTAIDINSANDNKSGSIEETATRINLEAAEEIAFQLRLRDIGGLIVIDFIDMVSHKNRRAVETRLQQATAPDRARIRLGSLSQFCLFELSRQRLNFSISELSQKNCEFCQGNGLVPNFNSFVLSLQRRIQAEASKNNIRTVTAFLPVEVAAYLLNEQRESIASIEEQQGVSIRIIPKPEMRQPLYSIESTSVAKASKAETVPVEESQHYQPPAHNTVLEMPYPANGSADDRISAAVEAVEAAAPAPPGNNDIPRDLARESSNTTSNSRRRSRRGAGSRAKSAARGEKGERSLRAVISEQLRDKAARGEKGERSLRSERSEKVKPAKEQRPTAPVPESKKGRKGNKSLISRFLFGSREPVSEPAGRILEPESATRRATSRRSGSRQQQGAAEAKR